MIALLLAASALAHPAADAHGIPSCDDLPTLLRVAQAFTEELRFDDAAAAIHRADACGADPADTHLATGVLHLHAGRPDLALPHLDAAVQRRPGPPARIWRAQALEALGRDGDAADDRLVALAQVDPPSPDLLLGAARALAAADRVDEALRTVDRGLAALGPVPGLTRSAITLAARRSTPEALARLDGLPRTVPWLLLRAEVLARSNRASEARAALDEAAGLARTERHVDAIDAALRALPPP